jgi:DNA repair exonuclease SbcCD ATPase subunit
MTTKAEERKALEQIKKIIESLGPNSYIATAMDGMIEDAEENIECDFAMSWKERAKDAETKAKVFSERAKAYDELKKNHETLLKDFNQIRIEKFEAENRAGCAESKMVEMKEEIVHLKAKLYDLMVKDA